MPFFQKMYDEGDGSSADAWPSGAEPQLQEEQPNILVSKLKEAGYDIDDTISDLDLIEQMSEAYQALQSAPAREDIEAFKQAQPHLAEYAQHAAEFQEWRKQAEQQRKQAEPEQAEPRWRQLEEDPTWDSLTEWSAEKGEWVPRSPYGVQAAVDRNRFHKEYQQRMRQLAGNPLEVVRQAGLDDHLKSLREELKEELRAELQQQRYIEATEGRLRSDLEQYRDVFFQVDKNGNILRQNNQLLRTEIGQAYANAAQVAQAKWQMQDRALIHEFAMDRIAPLLQASTAAEDEDEDAEEAPSKKQRFISRAKAKGKRPARDPDEGASIARAAARSDGRPQPQSWAEIMKEVKEELV